MLDERHRKSHTKSMTKIEQLEIEARAALKAARVRRPTPRPLTAAEKAYLDRCKEELEGGL